MVSLKSFKLLNEAERDEATVGADELASARLGRATQHQLASSNPANRETKANGSARNRKILNDRRSQTITSSSKYESSVRGETSATLDVRHIGTMNSRGATSNIQDTLTETNETIDSHNQSGQNMAVVKLSIPNNYDQNLADQVAQQENTSAANEVNQSVSPSLSSISIVVVKHGPVNDKSVQHNVASDEEYLQEEFSEQSLGELGDIDGADQQVDGPSVSDSQIPVDESYFNHSAGDIKVEHPMLAIKLPLFSGSAKGSIAGYPGTGGSRLSVSTGSEHFEIVWSNLSYRIEPKWYKKINFLDRIFSHFLPGQTIDNHSSATSTASSSAGMNDNQHQMHSSANADSHLPTNLNTKQKSPLDPIEIFANLNGTIKSGQMTAVLGPSGAGKTTLLNCLTGKLRKGVTGHINLIGANGKHLKMCTIPQKDHLLELLTVEENLWFASKIKNPEYGFDHVKNIERVIDLLGLKRCRSAKIKKISGGQHKRVSIAQELLSNPDILVLDEPTSGLDSLTCFKTISMLRDLVELSANNDFMKPMAIIVTIHQPQPKVFNLFHHVYILANGGRVIYEGPPELSLDTITSVTGLQPIDGTKSTSLSPGSVDPASFLIEIASEEYGVEPIKILNDYQRRIFYDTSHYHNSSNSPTQDLGGQYNPQSVYSNAKINHGYSPDYEHENKPRDLSNIFVPDQMYTKHTKESRYDNNEKQNGNVISEDTDNKKCIRIKKRKKSTYSLESGVSIGLSSRSVDTSHSDGASSTSGSLYMSEQLLYTREANHKGRFWSHTATLTHRTLLTIRRDPLLMTSRVLFHLMIPVLMGYVYGKATGAANACPHYEPEIDITQLPSLVEGKRIEYMLEELHMSIENVSMFFIIMYAFAAAVLALNALSFPLNMQVLLKETRNGWYSMSSYILAKTMADLPLELTMPCLTMALVYPLTGQPSSYFQWRMLTICLIMTLCSLIAQTQALILGALVMNSVQTAVFVSQASQLPWVILAGFTIRIKRLSEPLKLISLTSFYRLGCEAITLARYGFGICPCDPQEITGEPVRLVGIPEQLRTLAQYWIDSMESSKASNDTSIDTNGLNDQASSLVTASSNSKTDIFQHLANQLSYANSYGVNITSCDDVAPDRIRAINLGDNWLVARIWHLFIMLIILKVLLYYAVKFSIGIRL